MQNLRRHEEKSLYPPYLNSQNLVLILRRIEKYGLLCLIHFTHGVRVRLRGATVAARGHQAVGSLFKKLAAQVNHGAQIKVCCLRETFCQAAAGRLFSACVAESTERGLAGWCIVCCLLRGNKRARDSLDGLCTVEIDEAAAAAGGIAHAAAAAVLMYKREREREGGDTKASAGLVGWSNMCPA
jgi:hypothetical protein